MNLENLASRIRERAGAHRLAAVAFSGGVDSALAAAAAHLALGDRAVACTVVSELTTGRDLLRASEAAAAIGIRHIELPVSALAVTGVRQNLSNRCYHCKQKVFRTIQEAAGGLPLLVDGTNYEDDPARPGMKAAAEFGVFPVLKECGLVKADVRRVAREIGLPNWNAHSESCLATRVREGQELTVEILTGIEAMESQLDEYGAHTARVRPDNLVATVEYDRQYSGIMEKNRDNIVALARRLGWRSCLFKEWRG